MTIVDVRILVEGASDVEVVSKALQGLALGSEYNITISAIIPTTNLEIAKSAAAGADLLIIATDADRVGRELAERLFSEISELVGHVERMKIPLGHDLEHIDVELVRKEIKNTLVRAGLKSLQILPEYMALRNELLDLKGRYEAALRENGELKRDFKELQERYSKLEDEYVKLKSENENLVLLLEKKSNVFRLTELWKELFGEAPLPEEKYLARAVERLNLAGKVIVGQGYIYAEDEETVRDLLKTVYLSISFVEQEKKGEIKEVEHAEDTVEP